MFLRKFIFVCTLLVCLAGAALAQSAGDITVIPLSVDKGFSLQVVLTEKLSFKEGLPVHAKVIEPVYAFDREVIPSGTEVEGQITGFQKPGKWTRISAMLGGDFTPLREPQISFNTLVLPNGDRISIDTSVGPGTEKVVGSGTNPIRSDLQNSLVSTAKKPGKDQILKSWLWGMAPFHPQYLAAGTRLSAVLESPVDFGDAVLGTGALDQIGSEPPADSVVSVRLVTRLDSRTARRGAPVEALLTRPLFSHDHRLIFPAGTRVLGIVTDVDPARTRHHNGQLTFNMTTIAPPVSLVAGVWQPQEFEASLVSVQVTHDMKDLRITDAGTTRIVESKKRFIAPAWAFIGAGISVNATADPFGTALLGAYRGKFLKQVTGGGPGFGLPASISGAMVPPLGIGLGFFKAARSVYSTFLKRGQDIFIPENTVMEIRLTKATASEVN